VRRAHERVSALRANLPEGPTVHERYVTEYHQALRHLAALGYDVEEFKVPGTWIQLWVFSALPSASAPATYRPRFVERGLFLAKLDAVLECFTVPQEPHQGIGFRPPSKSITQDRPFQPD
jgi:hypothetical protein